MERDLLDVDFVAACSQHLEQPEDAPCPGAHSRFTIRVSPCRFRVLVLGFADAHFEPNRQRCNRCVAACFRGVLRHVSRVCGALQRKHACLPRLPCLRQEHERKERDCLCVSVSVRMLARASGRVSIHPTPCASLQQARWGDAC